MNNTTLEKRVSEDTPIIHHPFGRPEDASAAYQALQMNTCGSDELDYLSQEEAEDLAADYYNNTFGPLPLRLLK